MAIDRIGFSMRCPTGMSYPKVYIKFYIQIHILLFVNFFIQCLNFSLLLNELDFAGIGFPIFVIASINSHTSRIISSVLQSLKAFD